MTLVATTFKVLANYERRSLGMPELPMAIVPSPMGGVSTEEAVQRSLAALNEMITGLTVQPAAAVTAKGKAGSGFDATMTLDDGSFDAVNRYFYEKRWGDGLPIVPPTQDLVQTMLRHTDLAPNKVLGKMGPSWNLTTVHHVAVNAVMAGCRPEYFPVVVAGIDAVLDPEFNIYGVQGTTNPAGVMLLVNGPIARELDINGGTNLFGQGWYANGTIGRAVRLCLMNIGGGLPGEGDMSTLGNPNKWGSCIAENEAQSPWPPFHVGRGFDAGTSTVTAVATAAPQNVIELSADPIAILDTLARAIFSGGSNCVYFDHQPMVVLSPIQARHVANGGFDRAAVQRYLWEHGKMEFKGFAYTSDITIRKWKAACMKVENGKEILYPTRTPEDIGVVCAGGNNGPHSAVLATFNGTKLITRAITRADGTPVKSVKELQKK